MMFYKDAKVTAYHVAIFEGGDRDFDHDFIVVHMVVPDWSDSKPLNIFEIIDDECSYHDTSFGRMGMSDVDAMIRDLVTDILYNRHEDEWQTSWESVEITPMG